MRVEVFSGGSEPAHEINSSAVAVMAEAGIDIAGESPKPWTDDMVRAADVVVTMGCGDTCPFFPGKRYEDWEVPDPVAARSGRGPADPRPTGASSTSALGRARGDPASLSGRQAVVSASRSTERRSGTTRNQAHLPRCSRARSPASVKIDKWWLTVG